MVALQIRISLFFLSHLNCNWLKHKTKTNVETSKLNGVHSTTQHSTHTHAKQPENHWLPVHSFDRSFWASFHSLAKQKYKIVRNIIIIVIDKLGPRYLYIFFKMNEQSHCVCAVQHRNAFNLINDIK